METIAIVRNGRVVDIVQRRAGKEITRKRDPGDLTARLVDITHRPDIKVGHVWGTEPEGYGVTYDVVDDKIVMREVPPSA